MGIPRRKIQRLPVEVVQLIAAGEVIERPASVVKELIENSLDAGSTQIEVKLINGGLTSIVVRDNGEGIPSDEVPLLLERHITSKIATEDDLGRIVTLGFRGEALYSIAAVSDFVLSTRHRDEELGSRLRSSGTEKKVERISWPGGTQVESLALFASVPARRKFLRSASAEYSKAAEIVSAYAMAYPGVAWRLWHDGREMLRTPGTGSVEETLIQVFGADVARRMLSVDFSESGVHISGVISPPDITRARRTDQTFFLNGRLIKDASLASALEKAYGPFLAAGRHPIAVLMIECEPGEVDVNVHPHKREVRFAHPGHIASSVNRAAKAALAYGHPPAGKPPANEFRISQGLSAAREDAPDRDRLWMIREPKARHSGVWPQPVKELRPSAGPPEHQQISGGRQPVPPLTEPEPACSCPERGKTLCFADTYIIFAKEDSVLLIDQHNLHERILYETFRRRRKDSEGASQALLFPVQVRLTPVLAALVIDHLEELHRLGFEIEEFSSGEGGQQSFVLRGVPSELTRCDPSETLVDCLERAAHDEELNEPEGFSRAFTINLACKAAIKAGQRLTEEEVEFLIGHTGDLTFHTCPHGRPAVIVLDEDWFRKAFRRT